MRPTQLRLQLNALQNMAIQMSLELAYFSPSWAMNPRLMSECRVTIYVTVGVLLLFRVIGDTKREWINKTHLAAIVPAMINSVIALYFILTGNMDQYTSTVMLHGALLINAPQLLHLLKFGRLAAHRNAYARNWVLSFVHFLMIAVVPSGWGQRNLNFCPELSDAIHQFRGQRLLFISGSLIFGFLMMVMDYVVRWIDDKRNAKPIDRTNGEHSRSTFPEWVTWKSSSWTISRVISCILAAGLFVYSIYQLEYELIGKFHAFMNELEGLSSVENNWAIGQVIPTVIAGTFCVSTAGSFVNEKISQKQLEKKR